MRIVFFGTAEFAVPTLERLIQEPDFEVVAVVTQPDRPQGRGQKLAAPPVKQVAVRAGLGVFQPERLRRSPDVLAALAALATDFFVVAAYGQILPQTVLDMPRRGAINVHGSLLPKYRGAAPVQWAIYHGETETGVTTMRMDAGLDTGAMLRKAVVPIAPDTNAEQLLGALARLGADLLVETLRDFDGIVPEPQDDSQSSYAPLIAKEQYIIDWQRSASQIANQIRAFYPYAHTLHRGNRLRLLAAHPVELSLKKLNELTPGVVLSTIKSDGFSIAAGEGALVVTAVQPAGGRVQSAWDYANGSRLEVGERLGL